MHVKSAMVLQKMIVMNVFKVSIFLEIHVIITVLQENIKVEIIVLTVRQTVKNVLVLVNA